MTLQDHLNKGSCDFMELLYVTILPGLVAIDIVNLLRDLTQKLIVSLTLPNLVVLGLEVVDDVTDIIFHVTWQDHVIKGPLDLMEGRSSLYIPIL